MQTKYAESEKFTVVLSYAQRREQQAVDFLTENAPNIPAFNQLNPTNAPCGGGIPDAYLFDHTGRLVSRGHPSRLYEHVPALVAKVPDPIPPGILGTCEPRHLVDEAEGILEVDEGPGAGLVPGAHVLGLDDQVLGGDLGVEHEVGGRHGLPPDDAQGAGLGEEVAGLVDP